MMQLILKLLLPLCLAYRTSAGPLQAALSSPVLMSQLFQHFQLNQHRLYSGPHETLLRYRIFRDSVAEISALNEAQSSYTAGINFMADLTPEEREMYYGLNVTELGEERREVGSVPAVLPDNLEHVDWTARNKVAPVKDQKSCGSCWSFSGTGALESRYAVATGALKAMSDQEGLDCSYEDRSYNRDGCRGGWPKDVWNYIKKYNNHYSLESDYPYEAEDKKCRTHGKASALSHATLTSYTNLAVGDEHLLQALLSGAVAVAFKVRSGFNYYKTGIYRDASCPQRSPTHAVVATGYGPDYITVKNSWGLGWGDKGYIKFARTGNLCGISGYAAVPVLSEAEPEDDPKCRDEHRECGEWADHCATGQDWFYMATRCRKTCGMCECTMTGCVLCKDSVADCLTWAEEGYCDLPNYSAYMGQYCPAACNACGKEDGEDDEEDDDDEKCGNGLVWCHGECRHQHFC